MFDPLAQLAFAILLGMALIIAAPGVHTYLTCLGRAAVDKMKEPNK